MQLVVAHQGAGKQVRLAEDLETVADPQHRQAVHAGLGDCGAALDRIEEALEKRALWPLEIARDPRLDPLRESPRFRAVLGALRLN